MHFLSKGQTEKGRAAVQYQGRLGRDVVSGNHISTFSR